MNKKAEFNIAYCGDALTSHIMDVRDLAPALMSLGNLFDEANRVINGDKTTVNLEMKAQAPGSFVIGFQLWQSLGNQISNFLTSDFITSAINLKELVIGGVGLFWLIRKLQGKKPRITDLQNGKVKLEFANETFEVPLQLLRLYQELTVRKAVAEVLKPLERDGIEVFEVRESTQVIGSVNQDELLYFAVPEIEDEKILENESEAAYSIIRLAFKEDNKWRLYDGNATISVTIKDDDFLNKVERNLVSFAKGDILLCKVRTIQWRTADNELKTEYEVLKIKEHRHAARQLQLFETDATLKKQ